MAKATFYKWADLPETELTAQVKRRLVTGEKAMLVELAFLKGAVISNHEHPHEQITYILSGALEFEVQGEKRVIREHEVVVVPSNVPHAVRALEDTVAFNTFSPPREDFLSDETPVYMRK